MRLFLICITVLAWGCTKIERLENIQNTEPRLVVLGLYNYSKDFDFDVLYSLSVLDNASPGKVYDAEILLYKNEIIVDTVYYEGLSGTYKSNIRPEYGAKYKIVVSAPGYKTVTAESTPVSPLDVKLMEAIAENRRLNGAFVRFDAYTPIFEFNNATRDEESYYLEITHNPLEYLYDTSRSSTWGGYNNVFFIPGSFRLKYFADLDYMERFEWDNAHWPIGRVTEIFKIDEDRFYDENQNRVYQVGRGEKFIVYIKKMETHVLEYFRSIEVFRQSQGDFLAQPAKIYSNVIGGEGIFGYVQDTTISWEEN